jgi:hypothetical protein
MNLNQRNAKHDSFRIRSSGHKCPSEIQARDIIKETNKTNLSKMPRYKSAE